VRALARRRGQVPPAFLEAGDVTIDFAARRLARGQAEIALTAREWSVLEVLAARSGRLVSRTELLELLWNEDTPGASASLDVILGRLRRKLGTVAHGCGIRTVRGEGVVFERRP
jgi:DNA-binding response OmpR family regulator